MRGRKRFNHSDGELSCRALIKKESPNEGAEKTMME